MSSFWRACVAAVSIGLGLPVAMAARRTDRIALWRHRRRRPRLATRRSTPSSGRQLWRYVIVACGLFIPGLLALDRLRPSRRAAAGGDQMGAGGVDRGFGICPLAVAAIVERYFICQVILIRPSGVDRHQCALDETAHGCVLEVHMADLRIRAGRLGRGMRRGEGARCWRMRATRTSQPQNRQVYEHPDEQDPRTGHRCARTDVQLGRPARRSAVEQTDWHDQAESASSADRRSPRCGGESRPRQIDHRGRAAARARHVASGLADGLRKALRAEIDKDHVKMPVHEIEKHLAG